MPERRRDDIIEWSIGVLLGLGMLAPTQANELRASIYNSNIARGTDTEEVQQNVMRYALDHVDRIQPVTDEAVAQVEQIMSFQSPDASRSAASVGLGEAVRAYGQERGSANSAIVKLRNLGDASITESQAEQLRTWAASSDGSDKAVYELALGAGYISPRQVDQHSTAIGYSRDDLDPTSPSVAAALGATGGLGSGGFGVFDLVQGYLSNPPWLRAAKLGYAAIMENDPSKSRDQFYLESLTDMETKIDDLLESGALTEEKAAELKGKLRPDPIRGFGVMRGIVSGENFVDVVGAELKELGLLTDEETQEVSRIVAMSFAPEPGEGIETRDERSEFAAVLARHQVDEQGNATVGSLGPAPEDDEEIAVDFRTWIGEMPPGFKPGWGVFDTRPIVDPATGEETTVVDPATGRVVNITGPRSELSNRPQVLESIYGQFPALRTTAVHAATGAEAAMFRENAAEYRADDPRNTRLRYFDGDQMSILNWSATSIRAVQERLANAGMLVRGKYSPGMADNLTVGAFADLLVMSNLKGWRYDRILTERIENIDPDVLEDYQDQYTPKPPAAPPIRIIEPFIAPTFLKPDFDSLKQGVKQSMREQLRREPTDSEMRELTSWLDAEYRAQYDVQTQGLRGEYDARVAAFQSDAYEAGQPTYGSGGELRDVDPTAGYAEEFEDKFSGELDLIKRNESTLDAQVRTGAAIGKLTAMVNRGR